MRARIFTLGIFLLLVPAVLQTLVAQTGRELYDEATRIERTMGPQAAIPLYQRVLDSTPDTPANRSLRAQALLQLGLCYERLGQENAKEYFERIVKDYADQAKEFRDAQARLRETPAPGPLTNSTIFIADMDPGGWAVRGARAERLTKDSSVADSYPGWSPDGRRIKFRRVSFGMRGGLRTQTSRLVLKTLDDQKEEETAIAGMAQVNPFWSHDGKGVLTLAAQTREPDAVTPIVSAGVRLVGVSSTNGTLLGREQCTVSLDDQNLYCMFSVNSARLRNSNDSDVLIGRGGDCPGNRLCVIDFAEWRVKGSLDLPGDGIDPVLSPDGSRLAFLVGTQRSGPFVTGRLARVSVGSHTPQGYAEIASDIGQVAAIRWTRDGQGILFGRWNGGNKWQILRIPEQGGTIMFTGLEVTDLTSFDLSPDGSKIVFDGTDYKIHQPAPAQPPPPPTPAPMPREYPISGVWRLNAAESSFHGGAGSDRLTIRQYRSQDAVGNIREVEIHVDNEWRPHARMAFNALSGVKRPVHTEETLWKFLLDGLQSKIMVSLDANDAKLDRVSVTRTDDGKLASTSDIAVSPDNSKLTETRVHFDPQGRRVGTDVLVFDRIHPGSPLVQNPLNQRMPPDPLSSSRLIGVWGLNGDLSYPKQSAAMDLRRYDDLGNGGIGYLRLTLDSYGVEVSVAVLKSDAPENFAQAFRLSHPFPGLAPIHQFLNNGQLASGLVHPTLTYRAIDAYTSEIMVSRGIPPPTEGRPDPTYSRITVSRDGMTLTEVKKALDNNGEQTGETTLVYERIAP